MASTLALLEREDPETLSRLRGLRKQTKTGVVYLIVMNNDELRQHLLNQIVNDTKNFGE